LLASGIWSLISLNFFFREANFPLHRSAVV
jgi:hypothetical protein